MTKKSGRKGYTTDLTLGWVTEELGRNWLQWQQYAVEWLKTHDTGVSKRLEGIRKFLLYLNAKAPYAVDVATTTARRRGAQVRPAISGTLEKLHARFHGIAVQRVHAEDQRSLHQAVDEQLV